MLNISGSVIPNRNRIDSYTLSKSSCKSISSRIFDTIYKDLEVLLDIPSIEAIKVYSNYSIKITFLEFYTLSLYKGVLKLYDFNNELSRVVKDKDLTDKLTIVSEVLLHSILNSDHPDDILYNLRKRIVSHGLPLYKPNKEHRFF